MVIVVLKDWPPFSAIQAAILTKNPDVDDAFIDDICLIDVTPLTMGIAAIGDVMSILIRKNSPIPFKTTERYVTTVDNQSFISVRVHQGESPKATQNHFLGETRIYVLIMDRCNFV